MFRFSLIFIFILSFSFSHQFKNSYQGAIPSFTKTPSPGKVGINELYETKKANAWYGSGGKTTPITKWDYKGGKVTLDYFGMHGVGLLASFAKFDFDWGSVKGDLEEREYGIYYLWNNIKKGADLHDLTFKLTRIKTGTTLRGSLLEENGTPVYNFEAAVIGSFAIDFIISNKIIWSNLYEREISTNDDANFRLNKSSRLIYDISEKTSAAIEFNRIDAISSTNQEVYVNIIKVYGAYQFLDIQWGNLNFNLKIAPYLSRSISGKNFFKTETTGIEFNTYFN